MKYLKVGLILTFLIQILNFTFIFAQDGSLGQSTDDNIISVGNYIVDTSQSKNSFISSGNYGIAYPIYGLDNYYIVDDGSAMRVQICDINGNIVSDSYRAINNTVGTIGVDTTLEVKYAEGMQDLSCGLIRTSDFTKIIPHGLFLTNIELVVQDDAYYYICTSWNALNPYYYDLNGNEINDLDSYINNNKISSWAVSSVEKAIDVGLVPDELQTKYTTNITREEFCELAMQTYFIIKNQNIYDFDVTNNPFTDTDSPYVIIANELGIVSGLGDGIFAPNNEITRQESAVMLTNLVKVLDMDITPNIQTFVDDSYFATWARNSIYYITGYIQGTNNKIMVGTDINKFSPWMTYTREQAISTMYRIYSSCNI